MNEQNGNLYGQLDVDKLWSMLQACPELIKTYQTKDGATHHAVNVNIGYRKQPSERGDVAYVQIACKAADRKYDAGAYYVGDLKPSGQGGGGGNQPPMATNAPWGGVASAPAPMGQQNAAPNMAQGGAPQQGGYQQQGAPAPFPPGGGSPAPF